MNRIVIPSLLAVTVAIASIFAFAPIEQASTVHTTILANSAQVDELGVIAPADLATAGTFTVTCTADYRVVGLSFDMGAGTYVGDTIAVTVGGDDYIGAIGLAAGAVDALDGSQIGSVSGDLTVVTFTITDDANEDIENARVSTVTSGTCTFTDTE